MKESSMDSNPSDLQHQGQHLIQRCVIVQRDEKGYGLTVTGDNPVYVQSVKDDGAAKRAGVQIGDRIMKVNGTIVTHLNHIDVVELIKSGSFVALTLLGKPPAPPSGSSSPPPDQVASHPPQSPTRDHCKDEKTMSVKRTLDQERAFYEKTREEYTKKPSEKLQKLLAESTTRIKAFEAELAALCGSNRYEQALQSNNGPLSAPAGRTHNVGQIPRSLSESEWLSNKNNITNGSFEGDKTFPLIQPDHRAKSDLGSKIDGIKSAKSSKSRTLPGRLRNKQNPIFPETGQLRQHSNPEAFFRPVGEDNAKRKKSKDKKYSLGELISNGFTPPSPSFLRKSFNDKRSPLTIPNAWGEADKRASGSSPTPDIEPAEKRERSGSRLSNESSDNVFVNDNKIKQDTKPKTQMQILGQDDDEFLSDDEKFGEEHGPFNDLELLKNKPAHLAVFLHYLISNSDPSSLFFWLVTDSHREGNYKEMRKWSYEIYSSFLADKAPLKVDIDKGIVQAIEATLGKECSEETLRDLFVPASSACTSEINEQLADFRSKRALGLGSLFGDNQLEDENMDRNKEMEVVEHILLHHLENSLMELSSSPPNSAEYDRSSAMASALTTFMKQAGLPVKPGSNHANILEKCSSFTQKEGKSLFKIKTSKKIKGHHVVSTHYTNITFCNYCGGLLWGVADQGYQCTVCDYNVHKACFESIEETCPGPKSKRSKKGNGSGSTRRTALPNRSVSSAGDGRHVTNYQFIPAYNQPVKDKDGDVNDESREVEVTTDENLPPRKEKLYPKSEDGGDIESCSEGDDRPMSSPEEMIIPPASANTVKKSNHELFASRKFVIRSESVKTPKEIARKKPIVSGGIMNRSRKSVAGGDFFNRDNDLDALCVARGNDSPTLALDAVSEDAQRVRSRSATFPLIEEEFDSDMEADSQPPWQNIVDKKILKKLKQKEIKRQEVIHELIHTEKTHVRNLKVLDKVFYRPMKKMNIWPYDMIKLLFPNLDELIQIHVSLLQAMKKRELESEVISRIGDIMLDRFEGEAGERARETCATFCNNQKYALDQLKQRKSKDPKLAQFITNCELNPLCRRLKLNEIISTSYQRLTKYPLLLEGISRNTPSSLEDSKEIERAITCTKDLLAWVNQSVKECENHQRLIEFQKKIDKRQIDNMSEKFDEFKQLDLTKKKLVYDGPLTWRISSKKLIDLHVLLLEDMLILLQKQDDKLILKCHSTNISNYQEKTEKQTHSPILKLNNLLTRNVATDKKAFFLVGTSTAGPQIYELVAATMTERKCWYKHVTDTIEAFRCRDRGRRGGVSVAGVTPRGPEPSLKRRGGIPPPGISMAPPPPTVQENGKSNEEEEDEEHKEDEEEDSTESVQESKTTSSTREMEDSVVVIPVDSLPHPEPETETETETETGEDQESENEPLPPPPPPLESVTDSEPLPPPPQIRASRPSPPPISVVPPLSSLYDKTFVADLTNEESVDEKSPTQTSVISAFSESGSSSSSSTETMKNTKSYGHCSIDDHDDSSLSNRSSLVLIAEQLRGKDEELKRTLEDKARIVAELRGAGMTSGYSSAGESHVNGDQMEARDLILAAILQANRLTVAVSDILSPGPGEEDITRSMSTMSLDRAIHDGDVSPQQQLVLSTSILNEQLTALLGIITERDMARESLRCDLQYANTQIQRLKQGRSSSRRTRDSGSSSMISSHDEYSNFRSVDSHRISSPTSSMADIDSDYAPLSEASASDWLSEDNMDVGRSASFSYRDRNSFATSGYRSSTASSHLSRHRYPANKTYWSDDPDYESQF